MDATDQILGSESAPARASRRAERGFTLVELMNVIAVVGVLAALAVIGVRRHLASSKTAEAKNTLGALTRAAVAAYQREPYISELLSDDGSSAVIMHNLCGSAAARVPAIAPAARRYQPSAADGADFNAGDNENGWRCLRFTMTEPIRYSYLYVKGASTPGSGATAAGFEVNAQGDLDGDGNVSLFARGADVRGDAVVVSTEILIMNEYE